MMHHGAKLKLEDSGPEEADELVTGMREEHDKERVCGPWEDLSSWSEDGSLRRETRGRTWAKSDLVGHGKRLYYILRTMDLI